MIDRNCLLCYNCTRWAVPAFVTARDRLFKLLNECLYYPGESEVGGVREFMEAIIETGGKQYRVTEGSSIVVEKLSPGQDEEVIFNRVLAVNDGETLQIGRPLLEGARVIGKVKEHGRGKKIIVFKFKAKKNYRRKQGHRQSFTQVIIEKIES